MASALFGDAAHSLENLTTSVGHKKQRPPRREIPPSALPGISPTRGEIDMRRDRAHLDVCN
ncbi:hypothetical protein ACFVTJ_06350 [Agrobacterium sp. NPDC058088]|uniref:hypothetical protein n=1 Tax=Agrobacterium sp. NPDC058088 TaxID=3346335 RepID=UPI0036DA26CC